MSTGYSEAFKATATRLVPHGLLRWETAGGVFLLGESYGFPRPLRLLALRDTKRIEALLRPVMRDPVYAMRLRYLYSQMTSSPFVARQAPAHEVVQGVALVAARGRLTAVELLHAQGARDMTRRSVTQQMGGMAGLGRSVGLGGRLGKLAQQGRPIPVDVMPLEQRFADVLRRVHPRLPFALQKRFGEMLEGEALLGAVSVLMILGSTDETTGGFGNDALTVSVGFTLGGWRIFDALEAIQKAVLLTRFARTEKNLEGAAEALVRAVAAVGLEVFVPVLVKAAWGGAKSTGGQGTLVQNNAPPPPADMVVDVGRTAPPPRARPPAASERRPSRSSGGTGLTQTADAGPPSPTAQARTLVDQDEALGEPERELALDLVVVAADLAGLIDPTPTSDGISGIISAARGNWWDAAISAVSMIPYVGDLAKLGKLPRLAQTVSKAATVAKRNARFADRVAPVFETLREALHSLPFDSLPKSARNAIDEMHADVEDFLFSRIAQNAPVDLLASQQKNIDHIENIIKNHTKPGDFSGVARDRAGNPVPNPQGGFFDHIDEMQNALKGLKKYRKRLDNSLKSPQHSTEVRRHVQNIIDHADERIGQMESALKN